MWSEITTLLKTCTGVPLINLSIQTSPSTVEHFPLKSSTDDSKSNVPPLIVVDTEVPPLPPLPTAVTSPILIHAVEPPVIKKHNIVTTKYIIDPIVLGIEKTEPLYIGAPHSTQKSIETDAAQKLESILDTLYKTCSGRSRGWTKVGLEAMLKPRCASGGDLKELDRAKKGFLWSLATEDKALSAFLDFVCCARRIRCIVMNMEKKTAHLYPAADRLDDDGVMPEYPVYFVDIGGHKINGLHNTKELLHYIDNEGWVLQPPSSVIHSLCGLNLEELESIGTKLGMSSVSGKKAERVVAIAAYKARMRLETGCGASVA